VSLGDEAAARPFVEASAPVAMKVLLKCRKGHTLGYAVDDGLWLDQRQGGYFWHPDFDQENHLGRVPAWCDTCKVEGDISVQTAMKAVHERRKYKRIRMSNPTP
jgi:hypothetical protein